MDLKNKIYWQIEHTLNSKIKTIEKEIISAKESRDADTKSSAGDKHETSRALAQIEIDKLEVQLGKTLLLEKELKTIDPNKRNERVEAGSLVFTNAGNYFIAIGIGKLEVGHEVYYVISLASPVGELMKGKKAGDAVKFQGKEMVVDEIL